MIKEILEGKDIRKIAIKEEVVEESYIFLSDPGHGWLEVELKEIVDLNLTETISGFSYLTPTHVYLEEDADAPEFVEAWEAKYDGVFPKLIEKPSTSGQSIVRTYEHYSPDRLNTIIAANEKEVVDSNNVKAVSDESSVAKIYKIRLNGGVINESTEKLPEGE